MPVLLSIAPGRRIEKSTLEARHAIRTPRTNSGSFLICRRWLAVATARKGRVGRRVRPDERDVVGHCIGDARALSYYSYGVEHGTYRDIQLNSASVQWWLVEPMR